MTTDTKAGKLTWALEDHLCRSCGGRILRSVSGAGMTPGGDPRHPLMLGYSTPLVDYKNGSKP